MAPIDDAIESYRAQLELPEEDRMLIRALAAENGVSVSTLQRRVSCTSVARSEAHVHRQALSVGEEDALAQYIRRMCLIGHPPPSGNAVEVALELLRSRVTVNPTSIGPQPPYLGHTWLDMFRRRHPEVVSVWSRNLDTARVKADSPEKLAPWFAEVGVLMTEHAYPPSQMYNMDETGFNVGGAPRSTRVLSISEGSGRRKKADQSTSGRQEWVTSIECVSATGRALPPLVIFKGTTNMHDGWLPTGVDYPGWRWRVSDSGWTSYFLTYDWLSNVFDPQTHPLPLDPPTRRLLIVDGHGSHMKADFIVFCMNNQNRSGSLAGALVPHNSAARCRYLWSPQTVHESAVDRDGSDL